MNSLGCLLLFMVVHEKMTVRDIRRERQKPGPKTDVSLNTRYNRENLKQWRARTRPLDRARNICITCRSNPSPNGRPCLACRKQDSTRRKKRYAINHS